MASPPAHVLDLFAVPDLATPLPGGQGESVQVGDLVLSPGRDADVQAWLSPVLARFAYELDLSPSRRGFRVAMPVPARDGEWVVDGWAASRYEPGTTTCHDLDVVLAAGRLLHARLASLVGARPAAVAARTDRWATAERLAFAPSRAVVAPTTGPTPDAATLAHHATDHPVVAGLVAELATTDPADLGPNQLVHADLAGNVLIDGAGAAVVIDLAPAWRPQRWAEAVCVLDSVLWHGAPPAVLEDWTSGVERQAMLRAVLFRVLSDRPVRPRPYEAVLTALGRPAPRNVPR
ncbi:aminoglycoside phosphotransferase [Serinibacter arcticus]|uniref:Aminoglycoside phosphotransferase n=1 Tax=Serinibacter arcticus TaxID=1655435 RepID=A0A2U1ZVN1_9MICO|nr:aminoglycoside phosphotransferase [Serinibacter arcticus]PWD51038.1 aminoglycoside phosphotransferase [Serinibacter arcticus]